MMVLDRDSVSGATKRRTATVNRKTWLDWQREVLPGLPDPPTIALMSRDELLDVLRVRGVDVSDGTLAFWEKSGTLPRAVRRWRGEPHAFYPSWMLGAVEFVYREREAKRSLTQIAPAVVARIPFWITNEPPPVHICPTCGGAGTVVK